MKKLTCEMCGSTELIKQDGVFVCQFCGTKYSVEEAKKMMVEGNVTVSGTVNVENMSQIESLFELANTSYSSNNYSQTETFCNQIMAIDSKRHEAWKLKGEAISKQLADDRLRTLEAYNCLLSAYKLCPAGEQSEYSTEIIKSIMECFVSGEDFLNNQLISGSDVSDQIITFIKDSIEKTGSAIDTLNLSSKKDEYLSTLRNEMISKLVVTVDEFWRKMVAPTYYRDAIFDYGASWETGKEHYITPNANEYRPDAQMFRIFTNVIGDVLFGLLEFSESMSDQNTQDKVKMSIYNQMITYAKCKKNACSFTLSVGLISGWSWEQGMGWVRELGMSDSAKEKLRAKINEYTKKKEDLSRTIKEKEESAQKEKNDSYWKEHSDELASLKKEQSTCQTEIQRLTQSKKTIGAFKFKEKKKFKTVSMLCKHDLLK